MLPESLCPAESKPERGSFKKEIYVLSIPEVIYLSLRFSERDIRNKGGHSLLSAETIWSVHGSLWQWGITDSGAKKHVPPIVAAIVWLIAHALKMCNWGIEGEVGGRGWGRPGDRWSGHWLAWLGRWCILFSAPHSGKCNENRSPRLLCLSKHEMKEQSDSAAENPAWSAWVEKTSNWTPTGKQQAGVSAL